MTEQSKIEERRQRAYEAGWDASTLDDHTEIPDIDVAIETATRVKITEGAIDAACSEYVNGIDARNDGDMHGAIAAALTELGFEVES